MTKKFHFLLCRSERSTNFFDRFEAHINSKKKSFSSSLLVTNVQKILFVSETQFWSSFNVCVPPCDGSLSLRHTFFFLLIKFLPIVPAHAVWLLVAALDYCFLILLNDATALPVAQCTKRCVSFDDDYACLLKTERSTAYAWVLLLNYFLGTKMDK